MDSTVTIPFFGILVAVVVGSGILAERLSSDAGLQLLANSTATAGGLVALILAFAAVSGAAHGPVLMPKMPSFTSEPPPAPRR